MKFVKFLEHLFKLNFIFSKPFLAQYSISVPPEIVRRPWVNVNQPDANQSKHNLGNQFISSNVTLIY